MKLPLHEANTHKKVGTVNSDYSDIEVERKSIREFIVKNNWDVEKDGVLYIPVHIKYPSL